MFIFDLHCDTISECLQKRENLKNNDLHIDLNRGNKIDNWIQTFAFWIDDKYKGEDAYNHFLSQRELLLQELDKNRDCAVLYDSNTGFTQGKCNVIMAVEGGHVLGGDLSLIKKLSELGVSYLTLTWNGDNEIGCGAKGSDGGLTPFGKLAVTELEKSNIIVDISHLNEAGFWDVCKIATKPIIATHSNSREIHNHKRNLYDEQLQYLIQHRGLCGINLYPLFVCGKDDCTIEDIGRHTDHILSIGGQDILSIGTDFDGATMPSELNGIETLYKLYENMLKWYGENITDKIFYYNAKSFIDINVIHQNKKY